MAIRLLITDDQELVRAGLVQYLGMSPDIEVVAEAANGEQLLERLRTAQVDLLLLDMSMPGESGAELIAHVRRIYPDQLILVLSMYDQISTVLRAIKAGASGYITKSCSPQALLEAIRKIVETGKYLSPLMAEQLAFASTSPAPGNIELILSDRELEIFHLLVQGKSIGEIANQLCISDRTVSTHKGHLFDKLGLKNTVELVRYAMQRELFS
ncbi:MAG: response regulator transcription factor [Gallionella sp.]